MGYTRDLKACWFDVVRRMQSVSRTDGMAIVSISVLVDQEGCPRFWLEPTCKKIEPRKSAEEILRLFEEQGKKFSKL